MKKFFRNAIAMVLALLMLIQAGEYGIAWAVEEVDKAVNPAEHIEITVPERFKDGENWFFIPESGYMTSEKSTEKLYIPIQRAGDLDAEAEVTLKVIDLSARHDVNYQVEIYREEVDPEIIFGAESIVDLIQNADSFEEVETPDENDLGEMIYEYGGAEIVNAKGETVGTVTATPLDENGRPIVENETPTEENETPTEENETPTEENETPTEENETPTEENETPTEENETPTEENETPTEENETPTEENETPTEENETPTEENETLTEENETPAEENETPVEKKEPVIPGEVTESAWTEGSSTQPAASGTASLRNARNRHTGTVSDRQELSGGDPLAALGMSTMTEEEYNKAMAEATQESYPGKEYRLTFAPGEEAKFLVVTPMYSDAAEGDMQIMLMLKDPGEGFAIGEDVNPVNITILDEDEPEPVYINMAAETVVAENGKAVITVNRTGRVNAIKGVTIASWDGSAKKGDDYSGIGAKLYFGMGVNTRSVEIPVGHGSEQKDFYVTITALADEQITLATTHVIIPAAKSADGELMGIGNLTDSNGKTHGFSDPINLRGGSINYGDVNSDTSFHLYTEVNREHGAAYYFNNISNIGYAYDGMYVHYNSKVRWCWADYRLVKWNSGNPTWMHVNYFDDDEDDSTEHWLFAAWDSQKAPDNITIEAADVDKYGPVGTDSYVEMDVDEVRLIKRQFDIYLDPAEVKPLLGVSDNDVLTQYESVLLDGGTYSHQEHWTEDNFSVTAKTTEPLRLVGLEALSVKDNTWFRLATIDGKTSSVTVDLNADTINLLQSKDAIRWSTGGKFDYRDWNKCGYSGSCYKGSITVRPVFEYIDVTVEVAADPNGYGTLNAPAPEPALVWEFGSDKNMDSVMSDKSAHLDRYVSRSGSGTVNGYYSFHASGDDPYVYLSTPYADASDMLWVKIRARAENNSDVMQLFANCQDMPWYGYSCENIPLQNDGQWHEYIHKITNENWKNYVTWLRLDPLAGCASGDHIDIDYIAFFRDEGSAKNYQPEKPKQVFDFNGSNMSMDSRFRYTGGCTWTGYTGSDADAYVFRSDGGVAQIALNLGAKSVNDVRYMKVRVKNLNDHATNMRMYASINNAGLGDAYAVIPIEKDSGWREYVVDLTQCQGYDASKWKGEVNWARLDVGWQNESFAIDYIAFFSDEAEANAYTNAADRELKPGTYTYHLGDVLSFTSTLSEKGENRGMLPDGVQYELRAQGSTGSVVNSNLLHYINGGIDLRLSGESSGGAVVDRPYYKVKPTFTQEHNQLVVMISDADWAKLDNTRGILADSGHISVFHEDGYYRVVVAQDILANDIYSLNAYTSDGKAIPTWTLNDGGVFTGDTFYMITNPLPEENVITLAVPANQKTGYLLLYGTVATSTFNLNAERSATDVNLAENAWVALGEYGAWSDEGGNFELPAIPCVYSSHVRFLVDYNGVTSIKEAVVPGRSTRTYAAETMEGQAVKAVKSNAGTVLVESFSSSGARVESVFFTQEDQAVGAKDALALDGGELTVEIKAVGGQYLLNGERYNESITDMTVYFMDQYTGQMHASFSSNVPPTKDSPARWGWVSDGNGGGTFTLVISQFAPDKPNDWNYGDALMIDLTTDRKTVTTFFTGAKEMRYDPVSTGLAVIADPNYEPQSFEYSVDSVAEVIGAEPISDEDGDLLGDDTRASFGSFPYIGEITAAVKVISYISSTATGGEDEVAAIMADLAHINAGDYDGEQEVDDEGYESSDANEMANTDKNKQGRGNFTHVTLSILVKFDETFYGGVRFMLGLVASMGGGSGYRSQQNIFQSRSRFVKSQSGSRGEVTETATNALELIYKDNDANGFKDKMNAYLTNFAGPYFKFGVFVGIYIDFGYIELTNTKDGKVEKSHDAVFMGAGGFIGFTGSVGFTQPLVIGFIPAYLNVEAGASIVFFIGTSADPNKTIDEYQSLKDFKNTSNVHGQDFGFNFEFKGRIYVSGTFGVGYYKVFGVRVTVELTFELGYSNKVKDWYPNLFTSSFGTVAEAGFTGTIDLIVTSIPVYSASWPLPIGSGFMEYFQEVRRANKCISYVLTGVKKGRGTEADRQTAISYCDQLADMVDAYSYDVDTISDNTYRLKDWAYDHDIIDWVTKNTIEMNKQGGIVGTVINAVIQDDSGVGYGYRTNPHVHSEWVAADGQLTAAYSPVNTADIVSDAYAQPMSKIIGIGGNRFLMTFMDDTLSRDAMQAATLKWTVYNANNDSWTAPQTVQNDRTADSRPFLADAGDKVILTWASATDEKYDALRLEMAKEIDKASYDASNETYTITDDVALAEYMETDPARVMNTFDIFTVEFDKKSESFGEITQLTDDLYYDDYPQAVYDAETGDYLILYTKTAQDDEKYSTNGDKLMDIVGASPNPDKTYSVVMYMLYNGVADTNAGYKDDTGNLYDVPAGWVRDFLYENEFDAEEMAKYDRDNDGQPEGMAGYIADYAGQRFLPSTVLTESGKYADPPITDLTVASGYNGLASYAYTVDMDFDLKTAEDRALFFQTYDFKTHSTYKPVRVGGSVPELIERYDPNVLDFVTVSVPRQVEVGTPKLIRNGGSTFLFWREDGQTLKYLNVSELLNARVEATADDYDGFTTDLKEGGTGETHYWKYAVRPDGTFAADARTGEVYAPKALAVDFGSIMNSSDIEITEYDVIVDEADNLYVVWTDTVAKEDTCEQTVRNSGTAIAQEVYATALIHQPEQTYTATYADSTPATATVQTARWSKPYRITRSEDFNDGLALALADDGGLIIVHNRYSKLMAQSEAEVTNLVAQGKIGLTQDRDGQLYAASLSYNSPVTLSVTRCDKIGSLEATLFEFSDYSPVAGETVTVTAAIENVGLINAEGCEVEFYEYKNDARGDQIGKTYTSKETIVVNTAKKVRFEWTVPDDGPEGYSIQAVIKEKRADGGWYDDVKSYSDTFTVAPDFLPVIDEVVQDGDSFRVKYHVANRGNAPAKAGTRVELMLEGLYGDLNSERYGYVEDNILYSADVSAQLPAKTVSTDPETGRGKIMKSVFEDEQIVTIPASVFRFCGYDALRLDVIDPEGNLLVESDQYLMTMDSPMNVLMNKGHAMTLNAGESKEATIDYNSTVFMTESKVLYNVADPEIAVVDADGTVTGLSDGTTTLTATLLPSGRTTSITVKVNDYNTEPGNTGSETINVGTSGEDDSIEVSATVEGSTAAVSAPTEAQLETIAEKAKETGSVTIDLSSLPEGVTAASIPAETIKAINDAMDENGAGMTVKLPDSSVTLDVDALSSITSQAAGTDIVIHVETVDESTLNANQKEAFKDEEVEAVYDVYITADNERIAFLGDGRASITVTHEAKKDQKLSGFSVVYAAEDGTKEKIPTVARKDSVTFTVNYFSNYILTYSDPGDCAKDDNCPMSAFSDLDMNRWYHDGVHWALENGFMNGLGDGKFGPDDNTNRAMIVTMLHRLEGTPNVGNELTFTDVKDGEWYSEAIRWAAANGIVGGYGDGRFGPEDTLTREQLAVILCRYARYKGIDTTAGELKPLNGFNDAAAVSEWAVKEMRWAVDEGIINGVGNDTISPKTSATRAQVATMLMRYSALDK